MKINRRVIGVSLLIFALIVVVFNALFINPFQVKLTEKILHHQSLPASYQGSTVAFFSDVYYGLTEEDNLEKLVNNVNLTDPELVLFGGDLLEPARSSLLSTEERQHLVNALSMLQGKYGKYAVLGDNDLLNESIHAQVESILIESGFRILVNEAVIIFNDEKEAIRLVGIENGVNGKPDFITPYNDNNVFTVTLTHTPDNFLNIPKEKTALTLSGHSRGGQIWFPLIEHFYREDGARTYHRGSYNENGSQLYVSNGIGTHQKSIRLLADAEVLVYRLEN